MIWLHLLTRLMIFLSWENYFVFVDSIVAHTIFMIMFINWQEFFCFVFNYLQFVNTRSFTPYICLFVVISVSFFGDSHVAMPLQEAKLSTNLRLRFRSHQENALLFLAGGRTDYCLMSLDEGRIKWNLKINDYQTEVRWRRMSRTFLQWNST